MMTLDELKDYLVTPKNIVITTHQKPDGDAMGSSLALYNYLHEKGHHCTVITPTEYPDYFKWMPSEESVYNYLEEENLSKIAIAEANIIFCLDFNELSRIAPVDIPVIENENAKIVLVDHHINPMENVDFSLHDVKASSTCELIYRLIKMLEPDFQFTKAIATCIYTGILTDTGGFSNGATNKASLEITAHLLDCGLDMMAVQNELNQNSREERLRFIGNALNRKMFIHEDLALGYIRIDRKDVYHYNLKTGETEGLVNFPLSIKAVKVAVLLKEEKNMIKLSFRSKDDISVQEICSTYFEGGGHRNASGGKSYLSMEETIQKLLKIFKTLNLRNQ